MIPMSLRRLVSHQPEHSLASGTIRTYCIDSTWPTSTSFLGFFSLVLFSPFIPPSTLYEQFCVKKDTCHCSTTRHLDEFMALLVHQHLAIDALVTLASKSPYSVRTKGTHRSLKVKMHTFIHCNSFQAEDKCSEFLFMHSRGKCPGF